MLAPALSVRVRLYLQLRREPEEHVRTLSSHPVLCGTYQSSVIRDMHSDVSALRLHPCPLVGHPSIQSSASTGESARPGGAPPKKNWKNYVCDANILILARKFGACLHPFVYFSRNVSCAYFCVWHYSVTQEMEGLCRLAKNKVTQLAPTLFLFSHHQDTQGSIGR